MFDLRKPDVALVVASHADDEALGCAATMAKMAQFGWKVHLLIWTIGNLQRRGSMRSQSDSVDGVKNVLGLASADYVGYNDLTLPDIGVPSLTNALRGYIQAYRPSVLFCNHIGDLHLDHRAAAEAAHVATRPNWWNNPAADTVRTVLSYEIVGSTSVSPVAKFEPNVFIDVSDTLHLKMEALKKYSEEMHEFPHPRSLKTVEVLAQYRGSMVGLMAAEAFQLIRSSSL